MIHVECPDSYRDDRGRICCWKTARLCEHVWRSDYPDKRLVLDATAKYCRYRDMPKSLVQAEIREEAEQQKRRERRQEKMRKFEAELEKRRESARIADAFRNFPETGEETEDRERGGRPGEDARGGRPGEDAHGGRPGEDARGGRPGEDAHGGRPGEDARGGRPESGKPSKKGEKHRKWWD